LRPAAPRGLVGRDVHNPPGREAAQAAGFLSPQLRKPAWRALRS